MPYVSQGHQHNDTHGDFITGRRASTHDSQVIDSKIRYRSTAAENPTRLGQDFREQWGPLNEGCNVLIIWPFHPISVRPPFQAS